MLTSGGALGAPADCPPPPRALQTIPSQALDQILADHQLWVATETDRQPQGHRADLSYTHLERVHLEGKNLRDADLTGARLDNATIDATTIFDGATLNCAVLVGMQGAAPAVGQNLRFFGAKLVNTDLTSAVLPRVDLSKADLTGADLSNATLDDAAFKRDTKLVNVRLNGTSLARARFDGADVTDAIWEAAGVGPDASSFDSVVGLATLRFDPERSGGIIALLKALRMAGLDRRTDEVAHAIARATTDQLWASERWPLALFRTVYFSWGSDDGLDPARPWLLLLGVNLVFLPLYLVFGPRSASSRLVLEEKRLRPGDAPRTTNLAAMPPGRWTRLVTLFWLRSAVSAGIGAFNLPELLARLVPGIVAVRPLGWLASAAAVQAVLSLALIAYAASFAMGHPLG